MSTYLTNTEDLTLVANAIRIKGGTVTQLTYPSEFVSAINDIKTGVELKIVVSVASGATVTATSGDITITGKSVDNLCTIIVPELGTWNVSATLNEQISDTKSVVVTDTYPIALLFFNGTITVSADNGSVVTLKKDDVILQQKTSTGTVSFDINNTGKYVIDGEKNGLTATETVNVVLDTTTYLVRLLFIDPILDNNSWSTIRAVSDNGEGANYWSIGDAKKITLNGTLGSLGLSNYECYAFVIGFNHNAAIEGNNHIHFMLMKRYDGSNLKDMGFKDSYYQYPVTDPQYPTFRLSNNQYSVENWNNNIMRTLICGTNLTSYDGTILAVIPDELRESLKPVTKYTSNTSFSAGLIETQEYFFLLSEYEVFGAITYSNSKEKDRQQQYAYYSAGNSPSKYWPDAGMTTNYLKWWLRSPSDYAGQWIYAGWLSGTTSPARTYAYTVYGFAPAFCV